MRGWMPVVAWSSMLLTISLARGWMSSGLILDAVEHTLARGWLNVVAWSWMMLTICVA